MLFDRADDVERAEERIRKIVMWLTGIGLVSFGFLLFKLL